MALYAEKIFSFLCLVCVCVYSCAVFIILLPAWECEAVTRCWTWTGMPSHRMTLATFAMENSVVSIVSTHFAVSIEIIVVSKHIILKIIYLIYPRLFKQTQINKIKNNMCAIPHVMVILRYITHMMWALALFWQSPTTTSIILATIEGRWVLV